MSIPALQYEYLLQLEAYIGSDAFLEDFLWSPEERRLEVLNFLEKLMDLGETADEAATKIIFRKREGA